MSRKLANGFLVSLFDVQKGLCFHCNKQMNSLQVDYHSNGWTREHVLPLSYIAKKKMRHPKYNVVLAHKECNAKRGNKFPTKQEISRFYNIYKNILNFS